MRRIITLFFFILLTSQTHSYDIVGPTGTGGTGINQSCDTGKAVTAISGPDLTCTTMPGASGFNWTMGTVQSMVATDKIDCNSYTINPIKGSAAAITLSSNPQILAGLVDGQHCLLVGADATKKVTISNGTGVSLPAGMSTHTFGNNQSLLFRWDDTNSVWIADNTYIPDVAATTSNWIDSIVDGVAHKSQPAATDISGLGIYSLTAASTQLTVSCPDGACAVDVGAISDVSLSANITKCGTDVGTNGCVQNATITDAMLASTFLKTTGTQAMASGTLDLSAATWFKLPIINGLMPTPASGDLYCDSSDAKLHFACGSSTDTAIDDVSNSTIVTSETPASDYAIASISGVTNRILWSNVTAGKATALAANGANCSAGNYPLGVDASGAVEGCTAVPKAVITHQFVSQVTSSTAGVKYLDATYVSELANDGINSEARWVITRTGTLKNLFCEIAQSASGTNHVTFKARLNGADTAITYDQTTTGGGSDTSHTAAVTAGDAIAINYTSATASINYGYIRCSIEVDFAN